MQRLYQPNKHQTVCVQFVVQCVAAKGTAAVFHRERKERANLTQDRRGGREIGFKDNGCSVVFDKLV